MSINKKILKDLVKQRKSAGGLSEKRILDMDIKIRDFKYLSELDEIKEFDPNLRKLIEFTFGSADIHVPGPDGGWHVNLRSGFVTYEHYEETIAEFVKQFPTFTCIHIRNSKKDIADKLMEDLGFKWSQEFGYIK